MQRPNLSSTSRYVAWYARHTPETVAIVDSGSPVNWRNLAMGVIRCIMALKELGVGTGALVGLRMSERYPQLLLMLACEVAGATATSLTMDDLVNGGDIVRHCDFIFADGAPDSVRPATLPGKLIAVTPDWVARLLAAPVHSGLLAILDREIPPEQIARIVRTSGTTGRPKAMPMTHATQQLRVVRTIDRVAGDILPNPRFLCLYGLAVGSVYVRVLGVLQHGGTVFFTVGEAVDSLIASGAVNYATFTLGDIERTVRHFGPASRRYKLHIEVFGATVAAPLRRQIRDRLNAQITNKYSANETNPIAVIGDDNVGTLYPGVEVRIIGPDGADAATGEPGLIRVRTETMVHGYFNDQALTEACFIDGWYQTSDIGAMPAPGRLVLLGRSDDMLNIGGVKVAPSPLEARLKQIKGVSDAVVMSITNANEVGILLAAAETGGASLTEDVARPMGAVLAEYRLPFEIMPMWVFPRTETGKIKRHEIEATYRQRCSTDPIAVAQGSDSGSDAGSDAASAHRF
jgi:acyl-coenzyme A synthetase/AMP-(fatty) acid ligase